MLVTQPATLVPTPGMVVTKSCRLKPGVYTMASSQDKPVVTIKGDGITVDCTGVEFRGSSMGVDPDKRAGTGVLVSGKNVTVRGLSVRGYKVGLRATGARGIKILGGDYSYNWKQHLGSTLAREDSADWMSYHKNEQDEWLRYGAAIYLRGCDNFEVKGVKAWGGQNGLMLTKCNNGKVWNNSFCFLSSLGVGMYRSSGNQVMHNNIDWCVRGYSHGVYNRGQDSAGILVYEQSNNNTFAYNSVTHGGDGFFLWAGQTTMDTGQGGCNDNLLFANDFSHAPTNGIEATFSRNVFAENLILECWHGVWGGYSYDTKIVGNQFGLNAESIAIEHGQNNSIQGNTFTHETTAVKLWANTSQDPDWGYPKNRDTRSRDTAIVRNTFNQVAGTVFDLTRSLGVSIQENTATGFGRAFKYGGDLGVILINGNQFMDGVDSQFIAPFVIANYNNIGGNRVTQAPPMYMQPSGLVASGVEENWPAYRKLFDTNWPGMAIAKQKRPSTHPYFVAPLVGGIDPFKARPGYERGRRYILVDDWGPYDFQSPKLWPRTLPGTNGNKIKFEVLGPRGKWKVRSMSKGVSLSAASGTVPGFVTATLAPEASGDVSIQLTYTGGKTYDVRGVMIPAGKPVGFGFTQFIMPVDWTVSHWNFDSKTQDPRTQKEAFDQVLAGRPNATYKLTDLNASWGGSPYQGVNADYFATRAEGTFTAKPGAYDLVVTSDDGVRVWLDGKLVHDDWTYHAPKTQEIRVKLGGKHKLRVDHFELNGYSALKVEFRRVQP